MIRLVARPARRVWCAAAFAIVACRAPEPRSVARSDTTGTPAAAATDSLRGCERFSTRSSALPPRSAGARELPADSFARVTSEQMVLCGIGRGATESEVAGVLGPTLDRSGPVFEEMTGDSVITWDYPGLTVRFRERRADEMACEHPACVTADGVRIGDGRDRVAAVYGRGHPGYDPSVEAVFYAHERDDCGLSFRFTAGRVTAISVWCDYS